MSIWKEVRETMLKFGELVLNKAEILTQMAKLKIAIKNKEGEIDEIRMTVGDYTITQVEQKQLISEEVVQFKIEIIKGIKKEIEELNKKYEEFKSKLIAEKKPDAPAQAKQAE